MNVHECDDEDKAVLVLHQNFAPFFFFLEGLIFPSGNANLAYLFQICKWPANLFLHYSGAELLCTNTHANTGQRSTTLQAWSHSCGMSEHPQFIPSTPRPCTSCSAFNKHTTFHWLVAWPNSLFFFFFCSVVSIHVPCCHALKPRFQAHKKTEQMKERDEQDVVSLHENSYTC